jgi:hypothetical protein
MVPVRYYLASTSSPREMFIKLKPKLNLLGVLL